MANFQRNYQAIFHSSYTILLFYFIHLQYAWRILTGWIHRRTQMRLRCPDSSPGKGQTGIASAQERKTDALTHLHGCNVSRGNVEGGASHWLYHNPRHLPWSGKPHLSPGNSNTRLGAPPPWVSKSAWAQSHHDPSMFLVTHHLAEAQSEQSTNTQEKAQEAGVPASTQGRNWPSTEDAPACLGLTQGTHVCHQQVQPEHPLKSCQCPSELGWGG